MLFSLPQLAPVFLTSAFASPLISRDTQCRGISGPFLGGSFPDPSLINLNSTWYAFGTHNGKDVQMGSSPKLESGWNKTGAPRLDMEAAMWSGEDKPGKGWSVWAPDVYKRCSDGKFVMYFSARDKETIGTKRAQHCIGAAISDSIGGIYHPINDFVQCNRTSAGVIDPAWFKDTDNRQYVVYKTEIPHNYLEIREVTSSSSSSSSSAANEGISWASHAYKLLKAHSQGFNDGGNIEAPYIFKRGNVYFLAYSTHFTGDGTYDVQYATAEHVLGPYTRVKEPLVTTTMEFGCRLVGPGGASFERESGGVEDVVRMAFHGLTEEMDINKRVVYTATVRVEGKRLVIEKD
ncbi:glycoside hydrolase family 43 protein [Periconia macrospinosa]|uniref:Endo-1,5-alpha-L-arabinanase A n=1 Tax=Periconia macrospinosa TaxID=97972 RepID=A0A2V1E748_9PLEO|nr:glycoside hydrolase family 43 protein [Periconia macrospinosa]